MIGKFISVKEKRYDLATVSLILTSSPTILPFLHYTFTRSYSQRFWRGQAPGFLGESSSPPILHPQNPESHNDHISCNFSSSTCLSWHQDQYWASPVFIREPLVRINPFLGAGSCRRVVGKVCSDILVLDIALDVCREPLKLIQSQSYSRFDFQLWGRKSGKRD